MGERLTNLVGFEDGFDIFIELEKAAAGPCTHLARSDVPLNSGGQTAVLRLLCLEYLDSKC
jgi:hypothetical protein